MYRLRSNAVSGFRASDIVDGVRKQMSMYTPPPLAAPQTPLRDSTPVNAIFAVPSIYTTTIRSSGTMMVEAEAGTVAVQDASSISEVHWQGDSGDMEWICEDNQFHSVATLEFDMEFERDEDGDVIMKEPECQGYDIVDMDMEMSSISFVPQANPVDTRFLPHPPAIVTNASPASVPSTLLASPILVSASSSSRTSSLKGKERACPSIVEEDEGCVMKFTAPSLRVNNDKDLPSSSYMLGYVDGHPSSSGSTPDYGLNAVDDEVPILTL